MLQRESRKACGSRNQNCPGEVWKQTRSSVLLLTHQYHGAGRAPDNWGARSAPMIRLRTSVGRLKNFLAKRQASNYCVYKQCLQW